MDHAFAPTPPAVELRPRLTLWLLSAQHGLIHAQTAVLPLVFIVVIDRFGIGVNDIGLLLAAGNILAGAVQLLYAPLSRVVTRRTILGVGGLVYGVGMTALATATSWLPFSLFTIVARVGGSPQHPVGNALIAEQRPVREHAGAIAAHIAGGNLGTVAVPLVGAWLIVSFGWPVAVAVIGIPSLVVGVAILVLVRESGHDRAAARAHGSTLQGFRALRGEHDLRWLFAASSIAAAGRGIGVVSTFVPLYLARVLALDAGTVALMYTLLLAGSVPAPIVAGRLASRYGHRPVLFGTYLLGSAALATLVVAGGSIPLVWLSIGFIGAFVYEESSLLQALLAEVAPTELRDVAFSAYFTLMFVVGAIWSAALGVLVGVLGDARGFPVAFGVMAASYLAAILAVRSIRAGARRTG
jgi:FSR family fosmidomycin resistance protein-like MFS transporter